MHATLGQAAESTALSAGGLRRVLVILCVTETTSYGVLYYAFPLLAPAITADTGWSTNITTAAFSIGLVVSAMAGIPVGRLLDRHGPRLIMTTGSALAVPALLTIAWAPTLPIFFIGWVLAGIAMTGTLYAPAFAALTRWWGSRRVTALTALTLVAGFASTIFAPLIAAIVGPLGWRQTYLVLAAALAIITIPGHLLGLRGAWPPAETPSSVTDTPSAVMRSRAFVLLVLSISLTSLAAYAVVVNMVPLFIERGMSLQAAAWALGLGGFGQVLGRLGYRRLTSAMSVRARGVLVLGTSAVATAVLGLLPGPAGLLIGAAILAGAARGLFTLLHATAVSDRWGTAHYGRLNGVLSAPAMLATAVAPWVGAALADALGGYPVVFVLLALVSTVAAILISGSLPATDRPTPIRLTAPTPGRDRVAVGLIDDPRVG